MKNGSAGPSIAAALGIMAWVVALILSINWTF